MKTKISDIAAAAGVSTSTVARVINQSGYVSEEKRLSILKAIDELGYVPNRIASSLRNNKPSFLGHVLPMYVDNPFFARISNAVNARADQVGYRVLTGVTTLNQREERALIQDLLGLMVDAIIFTGKTAATSEDIEWILDRNTPVIMIERPLRNNRVDTVLLDSFQGSFCAVDHLYEMGHRNIGIICKKEDEQESEFDLQRYRGFCEAMNARKLPLHENWIQFADEYTCESGRRAMEQILRHSRVLPTAVYVSSDVLVNGALQALYEARLRVPEDISLISFDNTTSAFCSPAMTSIEMQLEEAGTLAVDIAVEKGRSNRPGVKKITLSPILVARGSVKDLR